jgi:hypothetical protein
LIAPEAAGHWLRGQKEKGLLEGWRIAYGDFDNDQCTPDNVIFRDGDDRIIDGYEINYGKKKLYNQNLLRNFPHTSYVRKLPNFPLYKDFYSELKDVIDLHHGKAQNWLQWRTGQRQFANEYLSDSRLMINVFVRKSLEGIEWKNEFIMIFI